MTTDEHPEGHSDEDEDEDEDDDGPPTKREAQQPIGPAGGDDTWLSGEDEHDPQREEAAGASPPSCRAGSSSRVTAP